jgi:hypothetical protein
METTHKFNVEGFERVASRLDKVNARVDSVVDNIFPVWFILRLKIGIEARLDALKDGFPAAIISSACMAVTCLHC